MVIIEETMDSDTERDKDISMRGPKLSPPVETVVHTVTNWEKARWQKRIINTGTVN